MAEGRVIEADLGLVRFLKKAGAGDLKKCYQCATCSSACNLSPEDKPFPRKEMLLAGWGQVKELLTDPDIWLCYQCNDCSVRCPRGAKPGDVLAAIRAFIYKKYSIPSFMGSALASPAALPLLLLVPMVVVGALAWLSSKGDFSYFSETIVFSRFLSHFWIEAFFIPATTIVGVLAAAGAWRFWKDLKAASPQPGTGFVPAAISVLKDIATHGTFRQCDANAPRSWAHLMIFYGFIGAALTTFFGIIHLLLNWPIPDFPPPIDMGSPIKWLGNVSAAAGVIGGLWMIGRHLLSSARTGANGYQDWLFLLVVFFVFLTGWMAQFFRLGEMAGLAYGTYYVHIVFVFFLLIYVPYSKFAHIIYRTVALIHARSVGRERRSR